MKKIEHIKENTRRSLKGFLFGIILSLFSIFLIISLISHNLADPGIFVASDSDIKNIFGIYGAYISDLFVQFFGLISYFLSILLFIWGWNIVSGKIHYIKHKYLTLICFTIIGCVVLNVFSSNRFGINIINKLNIDYFAGGFFGYSISKMIFVNGLNKSSLCKYIFILLSVIWLLIAKKAYFISFYSAKEHTSKILSGINKIVSNTLKRKQKENIPPIWEGIPNIAENKENKQPIPTETFSQEEDIEDMTGLVVGGGAYTLPSVELLDKFNQKESYQDERKIEALSTELCSVLEEFGVKGEILNVRQGPVVTMFEFRPAPGIKTSRVISLSDDIARSMSAISARISIIPGQNAIGIELPNKRRHTVYLRELLSSETFKNFSIGIPLILGKDISGNPVMADLSKMPHLLVAGTTGSGKSVSINDMILSILFKFSPSDCKLIMIDPKMLELSVYDEIPHLLTPVVTDPKKAVFALKWAVVEMENRYRQMSKLGVRNVDGFNKKIKESKENGDLLVRKVQTGFDQETGRPIFETQQLDFEPMPYIVVIVDEMADLMLVAGKDVETAIQRLAQMARAAGIHLIMATQRPSVDVITGTIKANFPTRIAFQVTSKIDSRTILGEQGAEQLLGQGDMLYMSGAGRILRVHGPFVKDIEVERVVSYIKGQKEPDYVDVISEQSLDSESGGNSDFESDDMYKKALEIIISDRKVSISYIQRKLQIGYNRAARIIEEMEAKGAISAPNHTGKREILV
ncbi:MAG: DNA translocase FtsK 4TM domain-containing protein [Holosporales bacterium]|jgi:S-DNA-T family DNA segregation ATPase FtsK/SpoIIIE|nr:DNA translocase FtsK 4TM domain-containing protein [Holosporales bacterium]